MFRFSEIDWKRLRHAAKETALIILFGLIMVVVIGLPVYLSLITDSFWFLWLYPLAFCNANLKGL